ncbi:transcriptional regulator domain-containing protein [Paracoccus denitrificans]|jgi:hypothetical protein|uniref:Transcriptional regulator-like domain-containing protein n=2 Tax=Paracoccus denitrificans TaxID=266 RepID=A1AYA1_PARDP|nr:DUF6499 domain-containing protein [Paracoccus denitrificans]ABL68245.1 hypothetical protein Pden_0128 [Paracoccus denitrificans PD1222]MBB4629869.1 hypothetical protein [Paracoccus denitrificans]MCU7430868.1 DUF6499 domain-containing protein [Paracoccus denitrificans]QAR26346.1 hypothetical protein EO213_08545 [Paracoccus denitrificans]UPV95269.1 DUF6499 domain-containing protein [Paracoccus denitrificans]
MPSSTDWRSPGYDNRFRTLDRARMTFQFLRRNRRYRAEYSRIRQHIGREAPVADATREEIARMARRWGLMFPGRSRTSGIGSPAALAS